MIHRALNSIPARPVLVIAPLLVATVLVVYYWNLHRECVGQAALRDSFVQGIARAADSGEILRLTDVAVFPWEHVKGFVNFKPQHKKRSCPFGWDWSDAERQNIIDSDLLSVLIFFNEGEIANLIEFRKDRLAIEEFESGLTPGTARFSVKRVSADEDRYELDVAR